MKTLFRLLILLLASAVVAQASLRTALQARAELGADVWSRVLRIENADPRNGYPATVYATIFEFDEVLWFYTDANGTQSLSLHRGRLDAEKADLAPLVRAISPDFGRFEVLTENKLQTEAAAAGRLPNGCFIDSLAAFQQRVRAGDEILRASLLSFYAGSGSAMRGHTVLAYETSRGVFLIDSAVSPRPMQITGVTLRHDAIAMAHVVMKSATRARWLPMEAPERAGKRSLMAAVTATECSPVTGSNLEP